MRPSERRPSARAAPAQAQCDPPALTWKYDAARLSHFQGVNLGFGDAAALAAALAEAVESGSDPGDVRLLREAYERPRRSAALGMGAALDGLKRIFAVSWRRRKGSSPAGALTTRYARRTW